MSKVIFDINTMEIDHIKFLSKVSATNNCWYWNGAIGTHGYGVFYHKRKNLLSHRVSYVIFNSHIDNNLVIDHVCGNKACVNPEHLRNVEQRTNVIENNSSIVFDNFNKTHCKNGHEFSGSNLKMVYRSKENRNYRVCRICYNKLQLKAYYARKNKKSRQNQEP